MNKCMVTNGPYYLVYRFSSASSTIFTRLFFMWNGPSPPEAIRAPKAPGAKAQRSRNPYKTN